MRDRAGGNNRLISSLLSDGSTLIGVLIDDTPIVGFTVEDGRLLLSVQLFDEANRLLVQIVESELVYSTDPWDVELVGRRLTVRHGPSDIFVEMVFEPPSRFSIHRGRLWRNGVALDLSPDALRVGSFSVRNSGMVGCDIGLAIGKNDLVAMTGIALGAPQRQPFEACAATEARVLRVVQEA